jgi:hypothetical protein
MSGLDHTSILYLTCLIFLTGIVVRKYVIMSTIYLIKIGINKYLI